MVQYKKLYYLGKDLLDRGYLLNALTLLVEACGYYAVSTFLTYGNDSLKTVVKTAIEATKNESIKFHGYHLITGAMCFFVSKNDEKNFLKPKGGMI